jgi:hypothetical protein
MCFGFSTTWNGNQTDNRGCSSLGSCQANDYCICNQGFYQSKCDQGTCGGSFNLWGANNMLGGGATTGNLSYPGAIPNQCTSYSEVKSYQEGFPTPVTKNVTYYYNQSCGEDILSFTFGQDHTCFLSRSRKYVVFYYFDF